MPSSDTSWKTSMRRWSVGRDMQGTFMIPGAIRLSASAGAESGFNMAREQRFLAGEGLQGAAGEGMGDILRAVDETGPIPFASSPWSAVGRSRNWASSHLSYCLILLPYSS